MARGRHTSRATSRTCLRADVSRGAVIWRSDDGAYQCAYTAASRADLDRYLSEFAPAMRADAATRFPGLQIGRAVWSGGSA